MAIDDNTKYAITGEQVKDLALRLATVQSKARMGEEAPTSSTEGELGQLYVVGETIYVLQDIVEESGEPTEYVWIPLGGDSGGKILYIDSWLYGSGTVTFYKDSELTTTVTRAELEEITNTGGVGVAILFSDPEQDPYYEIYTIIGAQNDWGSLYWTVSDTANCYRLDFGSDGSQAQYQLQLLNKTVGAGNSNEQVLSQNDVTSLLNGRVQTNAGAPTTSTVGSKGQLLEDTTNGKLYICTAATGSPRVYTWEEVGGSGGGITTLTSADYNWPTTGTKTGLAHWLLEPGIYKIDNSQGSSDFTIYLDSTTTGKVNAGTESIMVVSSYTAYNNKEHSVMEAAMTSGGYPGIWEADTRKDDPSLESNIGRVLKSSYIVDNLTSTATNLPLSAKQGKVLNDKITGAIKTNAGAPTTSTVGTKGQLLEDTTNGDLYICTEGTSPYAWKKVASITDLTSTIKTNAGAPTTSTTGTVGQLLEDTTNGKLYICTEVSGNTYTWTEVGASGPTVVQTTGTSTTNVMSQNAVTGMVFADPSTKEKVQIGNNSSSTGLGSIAIGEDTIAEDVSIAIGYGCGEAGIGNVFVGNGIGDPDYGSGEYYRIGMGWNAGPDSYGAIAIGASSSVGTGSRGSVAIGYQSQVPANTPGVVQIGTADSSSGYGGNSSYRLLTGLYDPQSAHDAATKGYVDKKVSDTITTNSGAPTTSTVGQVGQLLEDTTNGKLYICTDVNEESGQPTTYTWAEVGAGGGGGTGLTILSYGTSTYGEALAAYQANKLIYCRASSNSDPSSGDQLRMAFLAYVNNQTTPTEFEFQYYRSVSSKSATTQGDETFVYKLNQSTGWSVTKRNNYTRITAGTGLTGTYNNGVLTLDSDAPVITMTSTDPGEGSALAENHFIAVYSV